MPRIEHVTGNSEKIRLRGTILTIEISVGWQFWNGSWSLSLTRMWSLLFQIALSQKGMELNLIKNCLFQFVILFSDMKKKHPELLRFTVFRRLCQDEFRLALDYKYLRKTKSSFILWKWTIYLNWWFYVIVHFSYL